MRGFARCRKCRARHVLDKRLGKYAIKPVCRHCGGELVEDKWRTKRENRKKPTCYAQCLHYPHRRGTEGCNYEKDGTHRHGPPAFLPGIELPF